MAGLYLSPYELPNGTQRNMGITQMEPMDCCRMCPCFDEPAFKATWQLTVTTHADRQCISNTPPQSKRSVTDDGQWQTVRFAPTPKMSSYLLALCVADVDFATARTERGVETRVYAVPQDVKDLQFAADTSAKALDFYEKWFGSNFPLPKSDAVAVKLFSAGAMENWGLVTYRDSLLLVNTDTSVRIRRYSALLIAHELAHQWFGNLVTMSWWDDLWLNEGFATLMQFRCIEDVYPNHNPWSMFFTITWTRGMKLDMDRSTHPIEQPVTTALSAKHSFDSITYAKGCAFIRMMLGWLGEDSFQRGLRLYIERHAYSNTVTADLWAALGEVSGQPAAEVASMWTQQAGFPLVRVTCGAEGELTLTQERFFVTGPDATDKTRWSIPVTYTTGAGHTGSMLLRHDTETVKVPLESGDGGDSGKDYVLLNPDSTGFYLVHYSDDLYARVIKAAGMGSAMSPIDRANIAFTTFYLMRAGLRQPIDMVELLEQYAGTTELVVLNTLRYAVIPFMLSLVALPGTSTVLIKLQSRLSHTIGASMKKLGWNMQKGEDMLVDGARGACIHLAALLGIRDVIDEATVRVIAWSSAGRTGAGLTGSIREAAFKAAIRGGSAEAYNVVYSIACDRSAPSALVVEALTALGWDLNPVRFRRSVDLAVSDAVATMHRPCIFSGASQAPPSNIIAGNFVLESWNVGSVYGLPAEAVLIRENVLYFAGSTLHGPAVADLWEARFALRHDVSGKALSRTVERIATNTAFVEKIMPEFLVALGM